MKIITTSKWDQLQKFAKDLEKVKKSPLVKVAQKHLSQILGILAWRYGNILQYAFFRLEKDEDLGDAITLFRVIYTRKVKVAWDPILWDQESSKTTRAHEMQMILDFHASEMVHGQYAIKTKFHHLFQI